MRKTINTICPNCGRPLVKEDEKNLRCPNCEMVFKVRDYEIRGKGEVADEVQKVASHLVRNLI